MRITPLDVKKQDFRKAVRGFDCDEVRAFLTTLADEYETVLVDNKQIRERIMDQDDKIAEYKSMERTLRDTLMTAERLMQETRETAGREGDVIIMGAQQKAKGILQECRMRTEELRREIVGLRKEKETYLARFKGLAEAQISFIDSHKNDFADLDKRLVDLVDSVVEGTINSEVETRFHTASPSVAVAQPPAVSPAAPVYTTAERAPENHRSQEVDMWRDYNPVAKSLGNTGASATPEKSHGEPWIGPDAVPEAATATPEPDAGHVIPQNAAASVDFAAMGIPVPAVPRASDSGPGEETDAISEVISASLNENHQSVYNNNG